MGKKLYVGNMSYDTTEDRLKELFDAHGTVVSAKVITDFYTGMSRGFGFVEMSTDEEAEAAKNALNGQTEGGRQLRIDEARERQQDRRDRRRY